MKQRVFNVFISALVISLGCSQYLCYNLCKHSNNIILITTDNRKPDFYNKTPEEGLKDALEYYGVQHSDIVFAQAVLETGHFKSKNCIQKNNLFGISYKGRVRKFDHWVSSVVSYKEDVQYKYKPSKKHPPNEEYYHFLDTLGYAEDTLYVNKVRNIVKRYAR